MCGNGQGATIVTSLLDHLCKKTKSQKHGPTKVSKDEEDA